MEREGAPWSLSLLVRTLVLPGDSTLVTSPKPLHLPKAHLQILIPSLWGPGLQIWICRARQFGAQKLCSMGGFRGPTIYQGQWSPWGPGLQQLNVRGRQFSPQKLCSMGGFRGPTIYQGQWACTGAGGMHISKDSGEALSAVWAGEAGKGLCLLRAMWVMMQPCRGQVALLTTKVRMRQWY